MSDFTIRKKTILTIVTAVMQMQGINKLKIKIKTKIRWHWKPSYCDVIPIEIKDKPRLIA